MLGSLYGSVEIKGKAKSRSRSKRESQGQSRSRFKDTAKSPRDAATYAQRYTFEENVEAKPTSGTYPHPRDTA